MSPTGPIVPCPECREPTHFHQLGGIEVDSCGSCGGIWFDKGEFVRSVQHVSPTYAASWGRRLPPDDWPEMFCPRCRPRQTLTGYRWDDEFPFGRCPTCYGIYVQRCVLEPLGKDIVRKQRRKDNIDALLALGHLITKIARFGLG